MMEKYKANQRHKIERDFKSREKTIEDNFKREIEKTEKHYSKIIDDIQGRHKEEILKIREQERNKYQPIIQERENEIKRLTGILSDYKEFYDVLKDREFKFEEITQAAREKFERCMRKFQEGFAIIGHAQDEIEKYNKQILKLENHSQNLLKEE